MARNLPRWGITHQDTQPDRSGSDEEAKAGSIPPPLREELAEGETYNAHRLVRCDRSPRLSRFDYISSVGPVTGVRQINADGSPLTKVFRGAASLAYQNYDANGYVGLKALEFLSAGVDQSSTPSYNVTYADGSSNTIYGETRSEEFALTAAGGAPKILAAAKPLLAASRGATRTLSVAPRGNFARPLGSSDHALDFASRYADDLDAVVASRMRAIGVPEGMIGGVTQQLGGRSGAFQPNGLAGGNVFGRRINVDAGVFDSNLVPNNL